MLFNIFWLVLLSVINCSMGKTIYDDSVFDYECKTNENCADLVPNSICFNNKCMYQSRSRRQIHFESLGSRMLGDECEIDDECRQTPVDGTKICSSNQCECSIGYVPIDAYRCIQDFEQVSSNIQVTKTSEIEESPGYGSLCTTTNDCQHLTIQLECLHGTCVCLEGYVPLGKYLCYNIRGQGVPVIESSTLSSTLSTTITLPNNQMIKFFGKLGNTCTNNNYCQRSISKSHCYNGQCSCIDGYTSLDSVTCIENTNEDLVPIISSNSKSLLGRKCLTNENCHTLVANCLNNICTCPYGYFPIDDWNCFEDSDTKTTIQTSSSTTTVFHWWPWSTSSTTSQSIINSENLSHFHCLLNRECLNIDRNSHCTLYGRCVCNIGYYLDITEKCIVHIIDEEDCD